MQTAVGYDRRRAAALMEAQGLDLLFVTSPLNVWYTTGLPTLHGAANPILEALGNKFPNFGIVKRDGSVTAVHWIGFASVPEFCWADDSIAVFSYDMLDGLWSELEDMGLSGKRAGVEADVPKYVADALEALGMRVETTGLLNQLRLVKSDEEIARLTRAMELTMEVTDRCLGILKVGLTDDELIRFARAEMLRLGADDWNHFTIRFGDSDPEAPGTGRALRAGEIVRLDLGLVYKGYVSDLNKHAVIGKADGEARRVLGGLVKLQSWCAAHIRPGVNMEELGYEALEWYDENVPGGSAYLMGHSIGLQVEDAHLFGTMGGLDAPFEENMVLEIEAWESYEDTQLGVEDLYVVTKDGCRKLSSMSAEIFEIA